MKVLVYQSHIERHDNRPFRHELAEASRDSFKKYAQKHGYDYQCDEAGWIDPVEPKSHTIYFYAFQGLAPSSYDFVIYADSDVIARDHAPAFPLKEGFSAVPQINGYKPVIRDNEITDKQQNWVNSHLDAYGIKDHEYLNSGVWCASRKARERIWETWRNQRDSCKTPKKQGVLLDMPVLNATVAGSQINHLSYKWNAISDVLKPESYQEAYFIHYGGLLGSTTWKTKYFLGKPNQLRNRLGILLFNHFTKDMGRYGKLSVNDALSEIINKQFNHG